MPNFAKKWGGGLPLPAPGFNVHVLGMRQIMGINAIHGSLFQIEISDLIKKKQDRIICVSKGLYNYTYINAPYIHVEPKFCSTICIINVYDLDSAVCLLELSFYLLTKSRVYLKREISELLSQRCMYLIFIRWF